MTMLWNLRAWHLLSSCTIRRSCHLAARAWKLWLLLPRMLLYRPAAAACVAKPELRARFDKFFRGDWLALPQEAEASSTPRPHPVDEADFEHDRGVLLCLAQLLQVDPGAGDPLPDLTAMRVLCASCPPAWWARSPQRSCARPRILLRFLG